MSFVNDVINYGCLECVFYFRIKEKTHTHTHILYQLLFYNIPQKLFFILFLITSIE